jgi:hypothetical protein
VKRSGCAALGCAGALVVVLAALTGIAFRLHPFQLQQAAPAPRSVPGVAEPPPVTPEPAPDPDAYLPAVGALRQFQRRDEGDRLRLSYGFVDYNGRPHHVACEISKQDYQRDVTSFGYFVDEMDRSVGRRLSELFEREAERRGLRPYVHFEVEQGTGYRWRWRLPGGLDAGEADRLEAGLRAFDRWLDRDLSRRKEELVAGYLHSRGLRLQGDEISIDYAAEVERDTAPLQDCFAALQRAGEGDGERRLLGLFLAFVQELRYQVPPQVELGRHILGFWAPAAVLVKGAGDCDSKSAAFCALWRHLPERAILILVPGHALVGVEGKPHTDEAYVRLGNRYFVLCEVAGPGKIPPGGAGSNPVSGDFEYVTIEPTGR